MPRIQLVIVISFGNIASCLQMIIVTMHNDSET